MTATCARCNGSGEIGRRTSGNREASGPVPEDAVGWYVATCPDCHGMGEVLEADEDE